MTDVYAVYSSLRDRVVLVTGGASGIGAEQVTQFARQGAKVAFVDVADDAARQLIETLCPGQSGEEVLDKALNC